jgi:2-dehydro-3-deoxyphosphogluconate aldolase/(4S)-4-hydroxy-2-oxoglutarate aldolase
MAAHARLDVWNRLLATRLLPTLPTQDAAATLAGARGIAAGGAALVELLHRGDAALATWCSVVPELRRARPELIIGVGSIVDAQTAAIYLAHGADFVVSPQLDAEVATLCHRHRVAWIPGCGTVSEIGRAEALGAEIVKLFPAAAIDGAEFVRSLHGPQPRSRVMLTGNAVPFDERRIRELIAAGACALSMGPALADPALLRSRDEPALTARTRQVLRWLEPS